MKPYLLFLFILPHLLFALPNEPSSKDSSHSSVVVGAVQTGARLPGAMNRGAFQKAVVLTAAGSKGAVYKGALHTAVSSECKNRSSKAKKACTKRKCLKHHKEDSSPSGGVPVPVCSISLLAVLNHVEDFLFSAPKALTSYSAFHTLILLSPDLEQDTHPPRYS